VIDTTGTRQVVSVDLDAEKQDLVSTGVGVRVTLPDQSQAKGRIAASAASRRGGRGRRRQGDDRRHDPAAPSRAAERFDEAPVSVAIAREQRKDALTVPVTALVALPAAATPSTSSRAAPRAASASSRGCSPTATSRSPATACARACTVRVPA
jgi:hypothetical protein